MGLGTEGNQQAGPVLHFKEAEGGFSSTDTPHTSHLLLALRAFRAAQHPKRSEGSRALEGRWPAQRTPPPLWDSAVSSPKLWLALGGFWFICPPVLSASAPFWRRTLPPVCPEECGEDGAWTAGEGCPSLHGWHSLSSCPPAYLLTCLS